MNQSRRLLDQVRQTIRLKHFSLQTEKSYVYYVYSRAEAKAILANLEGTTYLIVALLYSCGLRLTECLSLRVKDLDFEYRQITIRDGKGGARSNYDDANFTHRAAQAPTRKSKDSSSTGFSFRARS
jgi:integrase